MNTIFKFIKSLSAVEKTIAIIALPFILLQLIATIPFVIIFFIDKWICKLINYFKHE
jgi:hypothetical protein